MYSITLSDCGNYIIDKNCEVTEVEIIHDYEDTDTLLVMIDGKVCFLERVSPHDEVRILNEEETEEFVGTLLVKTETLTIVDEGNECSKKIIARRNFDTGYSLYVTLSSGTDSVEFYEKWNSGRMVKIDKDAYEVETSISYLLKSAANGGS